MDDDDDDDNLPTSTTTSSNNNEPLDDYDIEIDTDTEIDLEQFVLDFTDAFWQVPLHPKERRFFVGKIRGLILSYLRAAQGSRNGPLNWACVASLAIRMAQSMFRVSCLAVNNVHAATKAERRAESSLRLQTYVDDPIFSLRGTKRQRDRSIAMVVLLWSGVGFELAFNKAERGRSVTWIGIDTKIVRARVVARIKADRVQELLQLCEEYLQTNLVGIKVLRSFIAKAGNFAQLLFSWRPFLGEIWAALSENSQASSGAPHGCIWVKQIRAALVWIRAFLKEEAGAITRIYTLQAHRGGGDRILICSDACPWGFGAAVMVNGVPFEYFTEKLTDFDHELFKHAVGDCSGQQVWEGLAILVSLRLWSKLWRRKRITLEVRSDNVTSLTMLTSLRVHGHGMTILGRELALDLGTGIYKPAICAHSPGVAHKIADALSRRYAPAFQYELPGCLKAASEVTVGPRLGPYWRSLEL